jgi:hypothetical protein
MRTAKLLRNASELAAEAAKLLDLAAGATQEGRAMKAAWLARHAARFAAAAARAAQEGEQATAALRDREKRRGALT